MCAGRPVVLSAHAPHRLTSREVLVIKEMVTELEYRHIPTGTLAVLAQRLGKVWASPSTWYHLVRTYGWRRPRLRVHPAQLKIGLRTTRANEKWHIDTTVIRLLDGSRAYLHAVIDNFSRRILAWRVAETFTRASCRHCGGRLTSADRPHVLKGLSCVNELPDDHPHDDFGAPAAAHSAFRGQTPDEMYFSSDRQPEMCASMIFADHTSNAPSRKLP